MAQITAGHPIVVRLMNLRKRVRVLLVAHGTGLLLAAFLATLAVLVAFDYLLPLGATLRLVIGLAVVVGFVALLYRRMIVPLSTRLTDQFLASRVENVNAGLADELIAAVHFIRHGTPQANALAAKAVEAAEARAQGVRFEDALDFRPAMRALGVAGALVALVVLISVVNPAFAGTAAKRWFSPMAGAEWPKVMNVSFLWDKAPGRQQPKVLPQGEAVEIRALVKGPSAMNRRVFLYRSTDISRETYQLMVCQTGESAEREAVYAVQISPEDAAYLRLRVEVADASTDSLMLNLARRPGIAELNLSVMPPVYVRNATARPYKLLEERATAVKLSKLTFTVRSTNPIGQNDQGQPDVRFLALANEADMKLPYTTKYATQDKMIAEVSMEASVPISARVQVKDENSFVNQSGGAMTLDVVDDAMPTVSIEDPRGAVRLVPEAVQPVRLSGQDDLGVDGGLWRIENMDQKPEDKPRYEGDMPWTTRSKDQAGNTITGAAFAWDLSPLKVKPGDRLMAFALVQDNYDVGGKRHDWVKSSALSVTIVSKEELRDDMRKELLANKERVDALKAQTEETKAKTAAVQQTIEKAGQATPQQAQQLADLTAQQATQTSTAKFLSSKFDQIKANMDTNKMGDDDIAKAAAKAKDTMEDVSKSNMTKATSELNKATDAAGQSSSAKPDQKSQAASKASDSAKNAQKEQGEAIDKMDGLSKDIDKHNDIHNAISKLNKLIDDQKDIGKKLDKTGNETFGKKPNELTPEEKKQLKDIADTQKKVQNDTADLMKQMGGMGEKTSDQAQKDALKNAVKKGEESQVTQNQGNAAQQASDNQTSEGSSSSGKATAGMQKMKDELEKISQRQLEALSQKLGELIKLLEGHLAKETEIRDGTTIAGKEATKEALRPIGDDQGRLHMATISTQEAANAVREAKAAVPHIKEAVAQMQAAAVELLKGNQVASLPPEESAISGLTKAIEELKKAKQPIDEDLKEKDLAYFIQQYTEIKETQEKVKGGSDKIKKNADGKVDRASLMALGGLTDDQKAVLKRLTDLNGDEKLKEYDAVLFINGEIMGYMSEAEKRLSKAQVGSELAWNQQRAIDRLADIIDALKEEKAKKPDFDKPNDGGGGGSSGGKPPLIPPAQQLKLLKMMQKGVNQDTVKKHGELAAAKTDAEKNTVGEQVQQIGKTQDKIQDVAKKIVEKLKQ